jgi:hypothetical protein
VGVGVAIGIFLFEGIKIIIGIALVFLVFNLAKKNKAEWSIFTAIILVGYFFRGEILSSVKYNTLRSSESGAKIIEKAYPSSYLMIGESSGAEFHGLGMCTAFLDVAKGNFAFVEIEVLSNNQKQRWEIEDLELGKTPHNYLSFFPGKKIDKGCVGVGGILGKVIDTNKFYCRGDVEQTEGTCIGVVEVDSPESQYAVSLFDEKVSLGSIRKYGIRVIDLNSKAMLGAFTVVSRKIRPLSYYIGSIERSSPPVYRTYLIKDFHHEVLGIPKDEK